MSEVYECLFGEIKEIAGYDFRYFITSKGCVFSLAYGDPRQLSTCQRGKSRNQYPFVKLTRAGRRENCPVHRLVAEAFIGIPPFHGAMINHIDGNKLNSSVENLEWVSASENALHAHRTGLSGGMRHGSFRGPLCAENDNGFGYVMFGTKQTEAAGFNNTCARRAAADPKRTHAGFRFSRMDMNVINEFAANLCKGNDNG